MARSWQGLRYAGPAPSPPRHVDGTSFLGGIAGDRMILLKGDLPTLHPMPPARSKGGHLDMPSGELGQDVGQTRSA